MDSCSHGNPESIDKLGTLRREAYALSEKLRSDRKALASLSPPEDRTSPRRVRRAEALRLNQAVVPHPDVEPILSRPRSKVSGRRRVPVLVNARGVPFLRIKKPQPRSVSRAINSKLETRWKRIQLRERLQKEADMANAEDAWDEFVGETVTQSWSVDILESLREVSQKIQDVDMESARLARGMWRVVLQERELADQEKRERIALRRQRSSARRKARTLSTGNGSDENAVGDGGQKDSEVSRRPAAGDPTNA